MKSDMTSLPPSTPWVLLVRASKVGRRLKPLPHDSFDLSLAFAAARAYLIATMSASLNPISLIAAALRLLGARPLLTLGVPVFASIFVNLALNALGSSFLLLTLFAGTIGLLFVSLLVVAYLLTDLGVHRPDPQEMQRRALAKLPTYLGYMFINRAALTVIFMITLMPALAPIAERLVDTSGNADLGRFHIGEAELLALRLPGVACALVANGLFALWVLVPVLQIAENRGLAAMGESARRVRPYFWQIYLISLVTMLVQAALLVFPQFLLLTGQLRGNLLNQALLGVPEGLSLAFSLSTSVLIWQHLGIRRQNASDYTSGN